MTAKVIFLQKFFIVVWHSNNVELSKTESRVNTCRMHIPMNQTLLMDVDQSFTQLSEYAQHLICGKFLFAVGFPAGYVIRSLSVEH